MELDRHSIERKDFPAARRGYDPDEVDRHLREIADSVGEVRRSASKPAGDVGAVASAAAEQVRVIVQAAEQSAAQIEENADQETRRLTSDAERHARETREKADADAADHVRKVEDATGGMLERARSVDSEIESLLGDLRQATAALAENLRTSAEALGEEIRQAGAQLTRNVEAKAGTLASDLESIRSGLGDVREARGAGVTGLSAVEAPVGEPEFEEIVEEPEPAAVADPAAPEPAPASDADALDYGEDENGYGEEDFTSEAPEEEELGAATTVGQSPPATEPGGATVAGGEGARLIALNMALNGTPREETAKYLADNFELADQEAILDDVYSRAGQG
ncbi:MAG: DivIVA domain-containing protein [Thermoleophilaceae bacterium]